MDRRILLLLAATTLFGVIAVRAATTGGAIAWVVAAVLGVPATVGLLALARIAYLDGAGARERTARARALRSRL